jgi:hypothetical protein
MELVARYSLGGYRVEEQLVPVVGGVERFRQRLELDPLLPQPTSNLNEVPHRAAEMVDRINREHVAGV